MSSRCFEGHGHAYDGQLGESREHAGQVSAPPAPAMMTRQTAPRRSSRRRPSSGMRWLTTLTSQAMNASSKRAHGRPTESDPITTPTSGARRWRQLNVEPVVMSGPFGGN